MKVQGRVWDIQEAPELVGSGDLDTLSVTSLSCCCSLRVMHASLHIVTCFDVQVQFEIIIPSVDSTSPMVEIGACRGGGQWGRHLRPLGELGSDMVSPFVGSCSEYALGMQVPSQNVFGDTVGLEAPVVPSEVRYDWIPIGMDHLGPRRLGRLGVFLFTEAMRERHA